MPPVRNHLNPALAGRRRACDSQLRYGLLFPLLPLAPPSKILKVFLSKSASSDRAQATTDEESDTQADAADIESLPLYEYAYTPSYLGPSTNSTLEQTRSRSIIWIAGIHGIVQEANNLLLTAQMLPSRRRPETSLSTYILVAFRSGWPVIPLPLRILGFSGCPLVPTKYTQTSPATYFPSTQKHYLAGFSGQQPIPRATKDAPQPRLG